MVNIKNFNLKKDYEQFEKLKKCKLFSYKIVREGEDVIFESIDTLPQQLCICCENEDGGFMLDSLNNIPEDLGQNDISKYIFIEINKLSLEKTGQPLQSWKPIINKNGEIFSLIGEYQLFMWEYFVKECLAEKISEEYYKFKK